MLLVFFVLLVLLGLALGGAAGSSLDRPWQQHHSDWAV